MVLVDFGASHEIGDGWITGTGMVTSKLLNTTVVDTTFFRYKTKGDCFSGRDRKNLLNSWVGVL